MFTKSLKDYFTKNQPKVVELNDTENGMFEVIYGIWLKDKLIYKTCNTVDFLNCYAILDLMFKRVKESGISFSDVKVYRKYKLQDWEDSDEIDMPSFFLWNRFKECMENEEYRTELLSSQEWFQEPSLREYFFHREDIKDFDKTSLF